MQELKEYEETQFIDERIWAQYFEAFYFIYYDASYIRIILRENTQIKKTVQRNL